MNTKDYESGFLQEDHEGREGLHYLGGLRELPVKSIRVHPCPFVVGMLLLAVATAFAVGTNDELTIKGFRVPEYDDDGNMTSQIFGDFAKTMQDGYIEVHGLTMEFYKGTLSNRVIDMRVTSPRCMLNREKKSAISDSDVRIARGDTMVVTGTGFMWNNNDQLLMIMTNSKVIMRNVRKNMEQGVAQP